MWRLLAQFAREQFSPDLIPAIVSSFFVELEKELTVKQKKLTLKQKECFAKIYAMVSAPPSEAARHIYAEGNQSAEPLHKFPAVSGLGL